METDVEAWREIRARADSVANVVFLLGGGALSVSIATLIGSSAQSGVTNSIKLCVIVSWWLLGFAMVASLLVKFLLIVQAYKVLSQSRRAETWRRVTTFINWSLALSSLVTFIAGNAVLIYAASAILLQRP
jgi:hypothetical protein